jgi:hypothetical protein
MRKLAIGLVALACVTATGPASAEALTPSEGQLLANGTAVTAPCLTNGNKVDDEAKSWIAYTYDPKRMWAKAKTELAPAKLPQLEEIEFDLATFSGASLQGKGQAEPDGSTCVVEALTGDSTASGPEVTLMRPGPYTLEQIDSKVHWVAVGEGEAAPTPTACENNNKYYPIPESGLNPPPNPEVKWAVSTYCNIVTVTHFEVAAGPGGCPKSGDGSQFPADPYLNQYAAGALDGLPLSFSAAGGNACGPSSLLMGLAHVLPANALPTLNRVFDETMTLSSALVEPNGENVFQGRARAVPYLQSIGFKQAKVVGLQDDLLARAGGNEIQINTGLAGGPIVISTDLGASRWGVAGGGHMVLVEGQASPTMYTIDDPAGNFFSRSKGHYNSAAPECGYQILYPQAWLMSATAGRWFLEFGPYTGPPSASSISAQPSRPRGTSSGRPRLPLVAAGGGELSAYSVFDAHPGTAEDPTTFYLEDPEGRKAGFIDGTAVSEIPYSSVGQEPPGFTDPRKGDEEFDNEPESEPPPTPRSIALASPQAGTTLHVSTASGGAYALTAEAWLDGARSAADQLTGAGNGAEVAIDSPALDTLIGAPSGESSPGGGSQATGGGTQTTGAQGSPSGAGTLGTASASGGGTLRAGPVGASRRRAHVTVSCARGRCTGTVTLIVRQKHRAVIIQRATIALGAGASRTIHLRPTAVGARLLRGHRRVSATLVVTQSVAPGKHRLVLRRRLTV